MRNVRKLSGKFDLATRALCFANPQSGRERSPFAAPRFRKSTRANWKNALILALATVPLSVCPTLRADLVFGDFENGLDPFLQIRHDNDSGNVNNFLGSVSTPPGVVTHGAAAGSFTAASGFQQLLRYDAGGAAIPGGVLASLHDYSEISFDINIPQGSVGFFV